MVYSAAIGCGGGRGRGIGPFGGVVGEEKGDRGEKEAVGGRERREGKEGESENCGGEGEAEGRGEGGVGEGAGCLEGTDEGVGGQIGL